MEPTENDRINSNSTKGTVNYDVVKLININDDYFNFNGNQDIELQHLVQQFETPDLLLSVDSQRKVFNEFTKVEKLFKSADLSTSSFPYLTTSVFIEIELINEKFKDKNESDYFLILIINHYQEFKKILKSFFKKNITENEFGMSHTISRSTLDTKVAKSDNFMEFIDELTRWYIYIEFIFFNLKLLDLFKGVKIPFEDKNLSLENNYGFSLKSFAKKNFLKLSGYLVTQLSGVVSFGGIDYTKLGILLLSSFTCGLSVNKFFKWDIGLIAFTVYIIVLIHFKFI